MQYKKAIGTKTYSKEFWGLFLLCCLLMFGLAFYQSTAVLYLAAKFKKTTDSSYEIYGAFSAIVYLCCVLSGYLTKKFANSSLGLFIGILMYACGAMLTAFPEFNIFILGLSMFAIGYGFIYTNTFFLLGKLYKVNDPKREGSFTLAYMGFNVGSLLGFFLGGVAIQYHLYSFMILLIGLVYIATLFFLTYFLWGKKFIIVESAPMKKAPFYFFLIILTIVLWLLLKFSSDIQGLLFVVCFILLMSIFWFSFKERKNNRLASKKLFVLGILTLTSVVYWVVYQMQDGLFLNFFAHHTDRHFLGLLIPAPSLLSINPIVILTMSPLLSWFWLKTGSRFNSPTKKVTFGLFIFGLSFIFLMAGAKNSMPTHLIYVVLFLAVVSLSELTLGPGSISMIGQLSTEKYHIILLGLVQLSTSLASVFSGQLSVFFNNHFLSNGHNLQTGYFQIFAWLGMILIITAIIAITTKRMMKNEI